MTNMFKTTLQIYLAIAMTGAIIAGPAFAAKGKVLSRKGTLSGVTVTIADIVRDNQPTWPLSIAPKKTMEVAVNINGLKSGHHVKFDVIGRSSGQGDAAITANSVKTVNGAGTVTLRSEDATNFGRHKTLQIRARLDSKKQIVLGPAFFVCAHPVSYVKEKLDDVYDPNGSYGVITSVGWSSDGTGTLAGDLNSAYWQEAIGTWSLDNPPFARSSSGNSIGHDWNSASSSEGATDTLTYPASLLSTGTAGKATIPQIFLFKCDKCGVHHVPSVRSGFQIQHEIKNEGNRLLPAWNHYTYNTGKSETVNSQSSAAGNSNVTSDWHRVE